MQLHVFRGTAPYPEEALNESALLEEIMLSQAVRPGIRHAIVALALASLAAGCSGSANPAGPSATPGTGSSISGGDAATAASAATGHDLPFKGTLEGAYTLAFPNATTLVVSGSGTGKATQLGQFTFSYDEVVNLTTGVGTGTYELTAANGDTLSADWIGAKPLPISLPPAERAPWRLTRTLRLVVPDDFDRLYFTIDT